MNYPDLLTGKATPAGTGINVNRGASRVFAATMTHESLSLVLPVLHLVHDPGGQCGGIDAYKDGRRVLSVRVGVGVLDAIVPVLEAIASRGTATLQPPYIRPEFHIEPPCRCDHLQRCGDHYRCLKCGNAIHVATCCLTSI